ncbi:MAG: radical SAM protein [bacterium]
MKEKTLKSTKSVCTECYGIVDAVIFEENGSLYMRKNCPEHGESRVFFHGDPGFYRFCSRTTTALDRKFSECGLSGCSSCAEHLPHVKTVMVEATERCNLSCPACMTNSNSRRTREITVEELLARLERIPGRPAVLFCGGEPTVREDLPRLIRAVAGRGHPVKVASNGLKLADEGYVRELKEAGLDWVLLQTDGFSDEIYRKTRGGPMMEVKNEALRLLGRYGIKVCVAVMVVRGVNDTELGRLVEFGMNDERVMHVGFVPIVTVGRNRFSRREDISSSEVMDGIERQTGGRITKRDFMVSKTAGRLLFSITGNPNFQQKSCFFTLLVQKKGSGYFSVSRYLNPFFALWNFRLFFEFLRSFRRLSRWDEIPRMAKFKVITIEEHRDQESVDLLDANLCNKVVVTEKGFVPVCIYNTVYRRESWLPEDVVETGGA